jgi:hypothetical protein
MYARNTFEHDGRYPNPFPARNCSVLPALFLHGEASRRSLLWCLLYLHALAHSSRFHTTSNARTFSVLRTLQQKHGGRGAIRISRPPASDLLTFNFELSTFLVTSIIIPVYPACPDPRGERSLRRAHSWRLTSIIPAHTQNLPVTPNIPALMQNRGVGVRSSLAARHFLSPLLHYPHQPSGAAYVRSYAIR